MNIKNLFELISANQRTIIQALLDHPEGLLSRELAEMTAVSNKSATMTPDLRRLLEEHGLELAIERAGRGSKWTIRPISQDKHVGSISETHFIKACDALDQISRICQDIKQLLC
jgi:hypothetical protein